MTPDGVGEIVRYDRAGTWYVERPGSVLTRRKVTVAEAADLAARGEHCSGKPGGRRFDALVRSKEGH